MNQRSEESKPIKDLPAGMEHIRVWTATRSGGAGTVSEYVAIFNLDDKPATLHFTWDQLGLRAGGVEASNVFTKERAPKKVEITLPGHGSTVYSLIEVKGSGAK